MFGTAGNSHMQLANFYPSEDQNLINIESSTKQSTLASGHKKNQLSLQSNKSTSKLATPAGYTLSTHQSTLGVREQNAGKFSHHHNHHQGVNNLMGIPSQISFTNPRNSTVMEQHHAKVVASHNSIDNAKGQGKNKTMIKNHSEYFLT